MIYIENDRQYVSDQTNLEDEILYFLKALHTNCKYDQFVTLNNDVYITSSQYNVPFIKIECSLTEYRNILEERVEQETKEALHPDTFFLPHEDSIIVFDESAFAKYEEHKALAEKHYDLGLKAKSAKDRNLNFKIHAENAKLADEYYAKYLTSCFENDLYSQEEDCNLELQNPMFYCKMIGSNINSGLFKKQCKKKSKFNYKVTQEAIHARRH